ITPSTASAPRPRACAAPSSTGASARLARPSTSPISSFPTSPRSLPPWQGDPDCPSLAAATGVGFYRSRTIRLKEEDHENAHDRGPDVRVCHRIGGGAGVPAGGQKRKGSRRRSCQVAHEELLRKKRDR